MEKERASQPASQKENERERLATTQPHKRIHINTATEINRKNHFFSKRKHLTIYRESERETERVCVNGEQKKKTNYVFYG